MTTHLRLVLLALVLGLPIADLAYANQKATRVQLKSGVIFRTSAILRQHGEEATLEHGWFKRGTQVIKPDVKFRLGGRARTAVKGGVVLPGEEHVTLGLQAALGDANNSAIFQDDNGRVLALERFELSRENRSWPFSAIGEVYRRSRIMPRNVAQRLVDYMNYHVIASRQGRNVKDEDYPDIAEITAVANSPGPQETRVAATGLALMLMAYVRDEQADIVAIPKLDAPVKTADGDGVHQGERLRPGDRFEGRWINGDKRGRVVMGTGDFTVELRQDGPDQNPWVYISRIIPVGPDGVVVNKLRVINESQSESQTGP